MLTNQFAPDVDITTVDGTEVVGPDDVTLTGVAEDVEDGDISSALSWTSSQDGALGVGATIKVPLTAGIHTITARSTDSGGKSSIDEIEIFVPKSQVGVAIAGSIWDTPSVPLGEGTSVATTSADLIKVTYAAPPELPPTLQLTSSSDATIPFFFLTEWDGKTAEFQSLVTLPSGDYTATITTPDDSKVVNFGVVDGTSNTAVAAADDENIFEDVVEGSPPVETPEPLAGDANLDGAVDFADFAAIATNFGKTDAVLADGDFDGDGFVGFGDFAILALNFGRKLA